MVVKAFPASFLQAPMARVSTAWALPVQGLTAPVLTVLVLTIQALEPPLVHRPLLTTLTVAVPPLVPSRYQLSPLDKGRRAVPDGSEICRRRHPCQRRHNSPGPSGSCGRWRISSLSRAEPRTWPRSHQAKYRPRGGERVAVLLCGATPLRRISRGDRGLMAPICAIPL
jgi:hypothetical protein